MLTTLDAEQVHAALPWDALAEALRDAFLSPPQSPVRHAHTLDGAGTEHLLLMPAWDAAHIGLKMVTVIPGAPQFGGHTVEATYLLSARQTGKPLALLDGDALTVRRTAAVSALAARHLLRPDAESLLIVGTGRLAPWLARAHCALNPSIVRVHVWGREVLKAAAVARELEAEGLVVSVCRDLADGVREADLVSCATTSSVPVVLGQWLRAGAHLDLVGAYTPQMRETDDEAIARARVFVDDVASAEREAGDIVQPYRSGAISASHVAGDLGSLLRGDVAGREHDTQVTCFKSVGLALEDLAAARLAVAKSHFQS
ncbi:MAG: ornithine cyclodeaminase family protein [Gemmatimonadaceae bacterium]|nr:ornithine cyclodeaminase family protein [Gemmatimonadaceae bacterium]